VQEHSTGIADYRKNLNEPAIVQAVSPSVSVLE
jgi:hypothetical protein